MIIPFIIPVAVFALVGYIAYASRNRYRVNIFQHKITRYIAILVLLSISLPILITGSLEDNPKWASFDMIISYILLGIALYLMFSTIKRIVTSPVRFFKKAYKTFITNISTYGSIGVGTYYGKGIDDEVNGVPVKWKMRFTFTDDSGKTRKDTSIMYYTKAELDYFENNDFAIKILGKHAVVTEPPFEKTKTKAVIDDNKCRYCGVTMPVGSNSCSSCGAKR